MAGLVSPGVDEIRWRAPVRPGDVLSVRISVLETVRSRSKPDRGMVRSLVEVLNQDEMIVMSAEFMNLLRCREAEAAVRSARRASHDLVDRRAGYERCFSVAVASRFFPVGSLCPHARRGIGALSTQALVNPLYAAPALEAMARREPPAEIVERITAADAGREQRQLHMVDARAVPLRSRVPIASTGAAHHRRGILRRRQHAGGTGCRRGDRARLSRRA